MLIHIVMFKFKPECIDKMESVRERLMSLVGQIDEIEHFEVGYNVVDSERAYDLALYSRFVSLEAMQAYQVHPQHQAVVSYLKPFVSSIVAVDYEEAQARSG